MMVLFFFKLLIYAEYVKLFKVLTESCKMLKLHI